MSIDIVSFIRFHIIPYSLSFQTFNAWKQLECLSVDETINQAFPWLTTLLGLHIRYVHCHLRQSQNYNYQVAAK